LAGSLVSRGTTVPINILQTQKLNSSYGSKHVAAIRFRLSAACRGYQRCWYLFTIQVSSHYQRQGCTNPGAGSSERRKKIVSWPLIINGSSVWNLLRAGFRRLGFEVAARFLEDLYTPALHPDQLKNVTKPRRLLIRSGKVDLPNFDGRYSINCHTASATLALNSWSKSITG